MRNTNQQKRMRGRNNTNRRSQNPLTRVYESNGPDVKVRGTVQHIVEKYQQLARDAQASGDHVAAENYLQHAEHYFRIIAAAQAQFGVQGQPYQRSDDDEFDEDMEEAGADGQPAFQAREPQQGPREGQRDFFRDRDGRRDNRERGQDRNHGQQDRGQQDRNQDRDRNDRDRNDRPDRDRQERSERPDRDRNDRDRNERPDRDRQERSERPDRDRQERGEPREGRWSRDNRPYREPREPREGGERYGDPSQQPQPRLGPEVEAEIGLPAFITQSTAVPVSAPEPAPKVEARAAEAPAAEAVVAKAPKTEAVATETPSKPEGSSRSRSAKVAPPPVVAAEEASEDGEARAPRTRRRRYRRAETEGEATEPAPVEAGE